MTSTATTTETTPVTTSPPSHSASQENIELQPIAGAVTRGQSRLSDHGSKNIDPPEFLPQPSTTVSVVERWNFPRVNIFRVAATLFSFVIMGANDAAYGAIIPYLEEYYNLSYVIVSLVFLSPLGGYAGAALLNNWIHIRFGQRGVAFLGPFCHIVAYLVICLHPPYPVLVVVFIIAGFGNGLEDAAWNAWAGNMANSNEVLGFLHGFYGLGALLSPLIATTLITTSGWQWFEFYYIMLGGSAIELVANLWAFWPVSGKAYREKNPRAAASNESRLKEALKSRVTWLASIFLLTYVGAEVALGGWIVTFMRRERAGGDFESGMVATGFWTGITLGRVVLGFLTPRLGEKFAVLLYLILAIISQLVFWLAPSFHVSAVAVSLQGFFLGPLFPAAIVAATKILPSYLHVSAIGFAAAFGGGGGAVLPFAIGSLAQAKGVTILQPVILAVLVVLLLIWICFPVLKKQNVTGHDSVPAAQLDLDRQWMHIDFDLIEVGKRTLGKARRGTPESSAWTGVRKRVHERREARAERKWIHKEIRKMNLERDMPAFHILDEIDPDSEAPPPYNNVRSQRVYSLDQRVVFGF